ncbi:cysteine--tRNA ligase [Candidatus Woesearchaeota archaeon]|nr:cysteine--tRNA ligase [Candidatus Woesearchaeota archaeon]
MAFRLYNTLSRKKEDFKPVHEGEVRMYSCGPTVYNYAHIGNLRAYVFVDLLRRYLKYKGFKLTHVMNITDVDDKTIRDSHKEGKPLKEFTEFYTKAFLEDLETLNIEIPEIMPKATEEIDGMVEHIKKLLKKGFAYQTDKGDVYFKISKFKDYGKLARIEAEALKKNADGRLSDADEYEKEDVRDFALWKAAGPGEEVYWDTAIGKGRPGWHIECSVMSSKHLGQPFDIHTGGVDLIFPHHTNEIAQSEAATGKKFVNYWIHNEHLLVNGQKMSKSAGNFYTLRDLIRRGYNPMVIRYELLSTHYRSKLDFRDESLPNVANTLQKFYDFKDKLEKAIVTSKSKGGKMVDKMIKKAKENFEKSMDDDLNISGALAAVFGLMTNINKRMAKLSNQEAAKVLNAMNQFDSVLGVMKCQELEVPSDVQELVDRREEARKCKNFALSDKLRAEIKTKGFLVEDNKQGPRVKKL